MKVTDRVRKNKIDIASENMFGEHIIPSSNKADKIIILLSLLVLIVAWRLS